MESNEPTDRGADWMLAVQAGDLAAFDRIVDEYKDFVHQLVYKFTGRREGVEDLAQEVFLRIYRARERYRPDAKFKTWIFRIVYNLCINTTKSRNAKKTTSLDAPLGGGEPGASLRDVMTSPGIEPPLGKLEKEELYIRLRGALAALPAQQRAAMTLYQYRGLSLREIADVMSTTEKAVKSLLARARENLREKMTPYVGNQDIAEQGGTGSILTNGIDPIFT
ncbi:MAG: RNA polymerase sigma factor [Planctomycetota bacterium]